MTKMRWIVAAFSFIAAVLNGYCAVTVTPVYWIATVLFLGCAVAWAYMAVEFK